MKSKDVSPNVRVIYMDTSGNADVVDLRKIPKKNRHKFVNSPRYRDVLCRLEEQQAALDAAQKVSQSKKTEPTTVENATSSPKEVSDK